MSDKIFSNPRLASVYDSFDGERSDLFHYLDLARELKAKSVLDIGCGTGCLVSLFCENGFDVIGLEPAEASLNIARSKPSTVSVQWVLGDVSVLPKLSVDLVIMTGNVAQVFTTDESWEQALEVARKSLGKKGHLVFEVRDPAKKAWTDWTPENTFKIKDVPDQGIVESWCQVTEVSNQLVSFSWTYKFHSDGEIIVSDSTLRFREKVEIEKSLKNSGFTVQEVRDAPDRPGKEFVFIASPSKA